MTLPPPKKNISPELQLRSKMIFPKRNNVENITGYREKFHRKKISSSFALQTYTLYYRILAVNVSRTKIILDLQNFNRLVNIYILTMLTCLVLWSH